MRAFIPAEDGAVINCNEDTAWLWVVGQGKTRVGFLADDGAGSWPRSRPLESLPTASAPNRIALLLPSLRIRMSGQ